MEKILIVMIIWENEIEKYIRWYNEDRIKTKLNGMSPVMYRLHSA